MNRWRSRPAFAEASAIQAVTFNTFVDAAAKAIVKVPAAAYVVKVYEEGDFSQLGIET